MTDAERTGERTGEMRGTGGTDGTLHGVELALRTLAEEIGAVLGGARVGVSVRTYDVLTDVRAVAEGALETVCTERARRGEVDADEAVAVAEHIRATVARLTEAHGAPHAPETDGRGRVYTWSCRYCRCLCYRTLPVCPRCGTPRPDDTYGGE